MFLLTSHAHTIPPPSYHPTTPLPPADPSHTLINTRHHPPSTLSLDGHSQPAVTTQSPSPNPPAPDHLSPPTHATTLSPDDTHSHTHMPPPVTAYPCHYSLPWWHSLTCHHSSHLTCHHLWDKQRERETERERQRQRKKGSNNLNRASTWQNSHSCTSPIERRDNIIKRPLTHAYPCHYSLPWWHSLTHTHVTTCLRLLHLRMRYHWLTFIFTPDLLTYKVFFRSRKCMLR